MNGEERSNGLRTKGHGDEGVVGLGLVAPGLVPSARRLGCSRYKTDNTSEAVSRENICCGIVTTGQRQRASAKDVS